MATGWGPGAHLSAANCVLVLATGSHCTAGLHPDYNCLICLAPQLEGVRSECEAAERSLEACRAELNTAVAKAAAAAEDCAKWRGTAQGLEVQLQQAAAGAEVSRAEAAELRAAAAAKDERLREMRWVATGGEVPWC